MDDLWRGKKIAWEEKSGAGQWTSQTHIKIDFHVVCNKIHNNTSLRNCFFHCTDLEICSPDSFGLRLLIKRREESLISTILFAPTFCMEQYYSIYTCWVCCAAATQHDCTWPGCIFKQFGLPCTIPSCPFPSPHEPSVCVFTSLR